MSRNKDLAASSDSSSLDPGGAASQGRPQFSIPDLLQLYRQTLYMAVKEADLSAAGNPFGEDGLAEIRADLDNWNNIEFDPPGCLRLSKKSGACQKIVSYWKKLLGSILTDRDPSSFGNHDRGVMTICKLLHKDFQIAVTAISKWNERDFPSIPPDQAKEKLSMNQLTFLCRRYHNDLTLIAHAFKSSVSTNDFKYLNPRMTETYPIVEGPEYEAKDESTSPTVSPAKPVVKRTRQSQVKQERHSSHGDSLGLSMASSAYSNQQDMEPRLAQFSDTLHNSPLPSPIDPSKAFFLQSQHRRHPVTQSHSTSQNQPILKSLLPKNNGQREREHADEPLDLGRSQARPTSQSTPVTGQPVNVSSGRRDGGSRDALEAENQKLREKTKKYVGMIMSLVQQIVGSGHVPFIDLRSIDLEDRADLNSGQSVMTTGHVPNPYQNGHRAAELNGSQSHKSPYGSTIQASEQAPQRRRSTKQVSNVSFDQATLRWHAVQGQGSSRPPSPKRAHPTTSTLSSLLSEPVLGQYNPNKHFSIIQHSNNGSPSDASSNGAGSKSKRKNNPVKRELPGYAAHLTSSPDAGGSDDAVSTGSGENNTKSVKASVFVPPVETTYVETRGVLNGGGGSVKRSSPDDMSRQVVPSRFASAAASNKRKCSLQTMADSLLFANGGLSGLAAMPEALPTEVPDSVSGHWMAPGTVVFAKLQDDLLFPGEILEKVSVGYVVAWLHDNFSSTIPVKDIFQLDEVFTDKRAVMVKMHDGLGSAVDDGNYHLASFMDAHRDNTYSVFTNFGELVRCHLPDLLIVLSQDKAPRVLDGAVACRSQHHPAGHAHVAFEPSDFELNQTARTIPKKLPVHLESSDVLRGTCFLITWQMTSVLNGSDDQHLTALIRACAGIVVKTFEELVMFRGDKFLVAPSACSTAEFFQCLAANIPCVSYQWVIDCYGTKTKQNFQECLLPAGIDKDEVIFWQPRDYMFGKRRIRLCSDSGEFIESRLETWALALKTGGVAVTTIELDNVSEADLANVDIVVLDGIGPRTLQEAADATNVTVVNDSWLKSSLIHGKVQDWDNAEFMALFD